MGAVRGVGIRETLNDLGDSLVWTLVEALRLLHGQSPWSAGKASTQSACLLVKRCLPGEAAHQGVLQKAEDPLCTQVCAYMQELQSVG